MHPSKQADFVKWFREAAPYVHAFGGRTFVIAFGGEVVADGSFVEITHDLNLLASLGVRLVLVHGARPQIEAQMKAAGLKPRYVDGVRVTDWRRGVTLLTIPRPASAMTTSGEAPAIAYYGPDNVVREIACDVCGPIADVEAMARERTTRDLTEAEQADFHIQD